MDRNTIAGILLIGAIILTYTVFFAPKNEDKPDSPNNNAVTEQPLEAPVTNSEVAENEGGLQKPIGMTDSVFASLTDSAKDALLEQQKFARYGDFYKLYEGESEVIHVKTEDLDFEIPTKGAYIAPLRLNKYKTYDSLPLPILTDADRNKFSIVMGHRKASSGFVDSRDLYFEYQGTEKNISLKGEEEKQLVFRAAVDASHYIDFVYDVDGSGYDFDFTIKMENMGDIVQRGKYDILWDGEIPKTEKAMSLMRQKTALYYHYLNDDVETLSPTKPKDEVDVTNAVDWVAFRSQFFSQVLMTSTDAPFKNLRLSHENPVPPNPEDPESGEVVKLMDAQISVDYLGNPTEERKFTWLAVPLDFQLLRDYDRDLEYQIQLGWGPLKYINVYLVIPIFKFLERFIGNYGLIIFILALLIKMLLYPLTFRMYKSTAKMRVLNQTPEMKELEEKFKDNNTRLQQEKMAIYRKVGVSPFGGCLPMILQYPFLISLFFLFPNSIELRQESFLWADDLSTYDSVLDLPFSIPFYGDHVSLFTLLMTVSIFVYTFINQKAQGTTQTGFMKYMPYFFPILFLGFLNNYSSGLSYYYFIAQLISIAQTMLSKSMLDDEKLLAELRDAKKKKGGKPKGRLAKWMENQQKKADEVRKAQQKQKGGRGNRRGK